MSNSAAVPEEHLRRHIADAGRVVLKFGSQVLCRPDGEVDDEVLARLCADVAWLRSLGKQVLVVSSGAVAMGKGELRGAGLVTKQGEVLGKQALAAVGQALLMSRYRSHLAAHGLGCAQLLLTHGDLGERSRFLHARRVTDELLQAGLVPIVNENDTVSVEELRFGDNDALAAQIAQAISADVLVLLTEVNGLYSADPHQNPEASLLSAVWSRDEEALSAAGDSQSLLGTGGMRSKVLAARKAGEVGIPTLVGHGKRPGTLKAMFTGAQEGSLFAPSKRRLTARRKWLRTSPRVKGSVTVDEGAAHALSVGGRSLLPVGVKHVSGRFGVGDLIRVLDPHGEELGRGLSRYLSEDLRVAAGLRTEAIRQRLGWLPAAELIHRDDFVS